ncbi:cohesin domain-containing protein [Domibacillus sp. PGB-M46]|uniref:Ig-like domain-containing protein n=1 Tax=Domibacillus sp. PGB-M46 TaxID=2910255 RepID=UPI001F56DEAF|nr:Ig-like domain-containing protein [Domibacillus sp. PGB-M46]MCI2253882.1 cohesin domain-containing protein [Domibacillus sp. PGB-M46]
MKKLTMGKMIAGLMALSIVQPSILTEAAEAESVIGATTAYEGTKGKVVTVTVYVEGAEESAGGSIKLSYDDTALTISKTEAGSELDGYLTSINSASPGTIEATWAKAEGELQKGTLLTFQARLAKTIEKTAVNIEDAELYKADLSTLAVKTFDGEVKPFPGSEQKRDSKVKNNKEWIVRLNNAVHPATVNKHNVWVTNKYGKLIDVNVQVSDKTSFNIVPKVPYASGTYTITISDQIRGQDGKQLKNPIKYEFTVE